MSLREVSGIGAVSTWRGAVVLTVVIAALGAVLGGLWGWHGGGRHQATAVILVNPLEGSPFSPEGQGDDLVNLETEAQLVTSDSVTGLVTKRLGLSDPVGAVRSGVTVTVPTNTQLLRIRATRRSGAVAIRRAQAFAETYLAYRRTRTESLLFDRSARINEQLDQLSVDLTESSKLLSQVAPRSPRGLLLQQQVNELTNRIGNLHTQLVASQSASTDPGQVVTPAAEDPAGLISGPLRTGAVGGLVGLVLAGFVLLGRSRIGPAVRHPSELEDVGVPVMPQGDQLAGVRARILAADERRPLVVQLATTAAWPGRSTTGLELGMAFGRANLETILVETVESPRGPEERAGLTDLLLDRIGPDEAVAPLAPHLGLLAPGTESDRLGDLMAGIEMLDLLTELRKRADIVILAGGTTDSAGTQAVVRLCDLTVLAVPDGRTTLTQVEQSVRDIVQSGGQVAGLVYVAADPRSRRSWFARHE